MHIPYRLHTDGWWLSGRIDPTLPVLPTSAPAITLPAPRDTGPKRGIVAAQGASMPAGERLRACPAKS